MEWPRAGALSGFVPVAGGQEVDPWPRQPAPPSAVLLPRAGRGGPPPPFAGARRCSSSRPATAAWVGCARASSACPCCRGPCSAPARGTASSSSSPLDAVVPALYMGFELRWTPETDGECGQCERAGGLCGRRQQVHLSAGRTQRGFLGRSDRSLAVPTPRGVSAGLRVPYKVTFPLRKVKAVRPSENKHRPEQNRGRNVCCPHRGGVGSHVGGASSMPWWCGWRCLARSHPALLARGGRALCIRKWALGESLAFGRR